MTFIRTDKNFAFATQDGNPRYAAFMRASAQEIARTPGMKTALRAACNALAASPVDYSNGAFFWDGADIKSNYERHAKVRAGIRISQPSHNIYGIASRDVPGEAWWRDGKGHKTRLRGRWNYKFESTAAWGGTIFWRYNPDFLQATGNKEYD